MTHLPRFGTVPLVLCCLAASGLLPSIAGAQPTWSLTRGPSRIPNPARGRLTFDPALGRLLLFGAYANDTWTWDGSTWTQLFPATSPPARTAHALVSDLAGGRVLLFGGVANGTTVLNDLWQWNGTDWSLLPTATVPPSTSQRAVAYDFFRRRLVLFTYSGSYTTWEWDGTDWQQRFPANTPLGRTRSAMAFDRDRGVVVLWSASDASTWEWDGTDWTRRFPVTSPPADGRTGFWMDYDGTRSRIVVTGGYAGTNNGPALSDSWEWDGTTWALASLTPGPGGRYQHVTAFDSGRQRLVLVGGHQNVCMIGCASALPPRSDTWEWDGLSWTLRLGDLAPNRLGVSVYDAARRRVVLLPPGAQQTWEFDGTLWSLWPGGGTPVLEEIAYDAARQQVVGFSSAGLTWSFDGFSWTQHAPAHQPPARRDHALAYDSARQRVVLFGGEACTPGCYRLDDLWEWDGGDWTQRVPAVRPPVRSGHSMAFDSVRGRLVLLGGSDGGNRYDDVWEWDGAVWVGGVPAVRPPLRVGFGLTFDAARGRTILFGGISVCGGSGCPYLNDTWEWDGIAWVERSIAVRPPLGADGSLAYDSSKGRSVLFGSRNCTGGTLGGCTTSYQTWEYGAACDVVGPGHPGGGLAITCTTPPVLGTTFCLSYPSALGSSYLALGPTPLLSPPIPLAPPGFCAPGSLYVLPIVLFPVAGNPASFCVPLPGAPQLAGASVVLQGAAPEAGGCFRLTDALVTILQAP